MGRIAYIESASGSTNTLLFSYTIVDTDNSSSFVFMEGSQKISGDLRDGAGNSLDVPGSGETRMIESVIKIDNPPVPLLETIGTGPNSGSVNVSMSERGTFYLVNDNVNVTNLASITGATDNLWNSLVRNDAGVTDARIPVPLSLAGLADGTYSLYAVDSTNNLSTKSTQSYVVKAAATAAEQAVKLVLPQAVDGGLNYYILDNTGDGVADALNQSELTTLLETYQTLIQVDGTKLYTFGGDTYKLASVGNGPYTFLGAYTGTTVGVPSARYAVNTEYDDLLAIWDAHNGELTNQAAMAVADWGSLTGASFWASNTSGGFNYHMNTTGEVGIADATDTAGRYAVFTHVVL